MYIVNTYWKRLWQKVMIFDQSNDDDDNDDFEESFHIDADLSTTNPFIRCKMWGLIIW